MRVGGCPESLYRKEIDMETDSTHYTTCDTHPILVAGPVASVEGEGVSKLVSHAGIKARARQGSPGAVEGRRRRRGS